tara:strand:- start:126 stop:359 length:234 start_codon:yes stop_codon:yes gene_type:complete
MAYRNVKASFQVTLTVDVETRVYTYKGSDTVPSPEVDALHAVMDRLARIPDTVVRGLTVKALSGATSTPVPEESDDE